MKFKKFKINDKKIERGRFFKKHLIKIENKWYKTHKPLYYWLKEDVKYMGLFRRKKLKRAVEEC